MLITVKFNPKSTAKNVKKAITLSEKLSVQKLTGNEKVISITQDNALIKKDFLVVLIIVSRLAKTELFFDEQLIEDNNQVYELLTCVKKLIATGCAVLKLAVFIGFSGNLGL